MTPPDARGYPLVVVTPTDRFRVTLRRYRAGDWPVSNVEVEVGEVVMQGAPYDGTGVMADAAYPTDDPRWPSVAADGVAFLDTDERQVNYDRLWRLPDGTAESLKGLPAGACFEAAQGDHWGESYRISRQYREQHQASRGVYVIKLPGSAHHWFSPDWACGRPDGNPERDGWTVTGTLPLISASPSVNSHGEGGWHGWIGVNGTPPGFLSRDLDGRPY